MVAFWRMPCFCRRDVVVDGVDLVAVGVTVCMCVCVYDVVSGGVAAVGLDGCGDGGWRASASAARCSAATRYVSIF